MYRNLRKATWLLLLFAFGYMIVDLMTQWVALVMLIISAVLIIGALFVANILIRRILLLLGSFLFVNVLVNTYSFWGVILTLIVFLLLFQTKDGNELVWFHQAQLHPFLSKKEYMGVTVVKPLIEQRSRVYKQPLNKRYQKNELFEWDDINIVSIGGDSIIDLGATILPEGENVVVIRKFFGRTRVIMPNDIGLKLNISIIKGHVTVDQDTFSLFNDCLQYQTVDYHKAPRKIKLLISNVIGDVEVIRL